MANLPVNYSNLLISLVNKFARLSGQVLERELAPMGITLQEFKIIGLLIGEEGRSQKDLAKFLSVKPATLSVAVTKLEEKGIIKRTVASNDKRINLLSIEQNVDFSSANELLQKLEIKMQKGISKKDIETTKRVLSHIIENLS